MAALSKAGLTSITVSSENQQVSFEGDEELAKNVLAETGYSELGSKIVKN